MRIRGPKHILDFRGQREMADQINALTNCKIVDLNGSEIGKGFFSHGNTILQIDAGDSRWQTPYKELDPDRPVAKGTWVYISTLNPIVTVGMTDPIGGSGTKAEPGIWEARKDVPASTGVDDYNVPQIAYPGETGTPTGTTPNYRGDLDGDNVFWIMICQTCN